MIGKIVGRVDSVYADHLILDVSGIGYMVFCSSKTLANLVLNEEKILFIHTYIRDENFDLYGFNDFSEKYSFLLLTSVKGVGNKMGLNILSSISPEEISYALSTNNKKIFHDIAGIGKKLAERIIIELKDRFAVSTPSNPKIAANLQVASINPHDMTMLSSAISALTNLGMQADVAHSVIHKLFIQNKDISLEDLIKLALKGK
ncbi:Holliday junction branch migration protein RuvA [Rickettsia endosymbiont of Cardiosporidium cionae]|uniref:Holliday junction branch migration protein RuvA n=1 Tax=Rickettsia endosymbiont of Cardiosporidium cionae TaxID=2777155 RepID=UPI001895385B|nr:Holliday junction branch migration protein RuvA [Rickettsia endosymbiont of Cardiosporidium cionae]KAF8818716.1 Holliday junction branch migration protein RuvA [Rickettsia endosymbiont of Cardiosporidium cionae]